MKTISALFSFFLVLLGCARQQSPSTEAIPGKYRGEYMNASESFELRPDLTFVQELTLNGVLVYRNEGTWRIDNTDVAFDHFFYSIQRGSTKVVVPKIGTDNVRGLWVTLNGRSEIVFDVDHNYRIKKQ